MAGHSNPVDLVAFTNLGISDPAIIHGILVSFIRESREDMERMRMALAQKNVPMLHALAHRAKSPSMMLGIKGFSELCVTLEEIRNPDDIQQAHGILNCLHELLECVSKQADCQEIKPA